MSHIAPPNEPVTGVGIARFALAALVVLWIALVVWALRNDERLLAAFAQPAGVAPTLASGSPSVADADADARSEPEPVDDAAPSGSEADGRPGSTPGPRAPDREEEIPAREGTDAAVAPVIGSEVTPVDAVIAPPPLASAFDIRRREELDMLATLLSGVAFEPLGDTLVDEARERLERAFEILFLYSRTRVELVVESRETTDPAENAGLDRARVQRVVDYLVSRGIERDRLVVGTGEGRGLPFGEHRVRVIVEDEER